MVHEVVMPQMGESIVEATITNWLKKVGDRVERDEPLFEISTEKVDAEIPSPAAGTLREVRAKAGELVRVNSVIAVVDDSGAAVATEAQAAEPHAPPLAPSEELRSEVKEPRVSVTAEPGAAAATASERSAELAGPVSPEDEGAKVLPRTKEPGGARPNGREASSARSGARVEHAEESRPVRSSPLVRRIAAEHGVDVRNLKGSGFSGRVTKQDILEHLAEPVEPAPASETTAQARSGSGVLEAYRPRVLDGDRVEAMSTMRAKIGEHMVLSRRISAHVTTVHDIDMSRIAALRGRFSEEWKTQHGVAPTYTAFIMKAVVDTLQNFPMLNASLLDGSRIIYHRRVNLGLAVALEGGLIVPVVQGADELNLLGLARRAADLAARARAKRLMPDEVRDGTFTISNPGAYGATFFTPIINQPQVAILGVGAIEKRPVVIDDMLAIRTRCYFSLSFDHRIVDGSVADQFMARLRTHLENFDDAQV